MMRFRFSPPVYAFAIGSVVAIVVAIASVVAYKAANSNAGKPLALADRGVSQSQVELCSPYANICFTRPSNWQRSSILHVVGTKQNTIEINPPTGTLLELAQSGNNTSTSCDKAVYKDCLIKTSKITSLQNHLKIVTGMLIDSPDANCSNECPAPQYTPFVILVSEDDFSKYKLGKDTATFDVFNPTARVSHGQAVYLQVTPGKLFNIEEANRWQNSSEAHTAQQIFGSIRLYK